MRKSFISF